MKHKLPPVFQRFSPAWLLGIIWVVAALLCLMALPIAGNAILDRGFWFLPRPPVPAYAKNVKFLKPGSLGGYRIIQFETGGTADEVRQYYRTELSERGWDYLCSPTELEETDCPLGLSPTAELADAYKRDDEPEKVRAIGITIYKPGEYLAGIEDRVVEVIEYRYTPVR